MPRDVPVRLRQPLIILVTFVVGGLVCGWLWHQLWAPAPSGVAFDGEMYFDDDAVFRATGLYVLIAVPAGAVLGGLLTALLDRDEVATLISVVVSALVAGVVMAQVGGILGPDSPQAVADSLTEHPGEVTADLTVASAAVWTCLPAGGVLGALCILVVLHKRPRREPSSAAARRSIDNLTESTDVT